ncbi:MAG: hypothetical protein EHM71_04065 [Zetaproteobacteria bacterium]|nr:MAG: hypothetical protein EHM71_04065 [Zetaproteobacteria bacterium]
MSAEEISPRELRARVRLSRHEIAHLWNGGVLSLKVEGQDAEADPEISCADAESSRGVRILVKRVSAT